MDKDEVIRDIANVLDRCCNEFDDSGRHIRNLCSDCAFWSEENYCCCSYNKKQSIALYKAGYRKEQEAVRDFAKIIMSIIFEDEKDETMKIRDFHDTIRDVLRMNYGIEL